MALDTFRLEAFFAVAKLRNFSKAAKRIAITQSALSQRIAKLESELEAALFIRSPSGIKLTPAGEDLLRYCQMKQGLEDELLSRFKSDRNSAGPTRDTANRRLLLRNSICSYASFAEANSGKPGS